MGRNSQAPLFLVCCVALLAVWLTFTSAGGGSTAPPRESPPDTSQLLLPGAARPHPAVAPSARRFLVAFLSYEVGAGDSEVRAALRATTTPAFADQLLQQRSRRSAEHPAPNPRLGDLAVVLLSVNPPLASVTATARRPSGPEQLSFVFALRNGRWLASAPGA